MRRKKTKSLHGHKEQINVRAALLENQTCISILYTDLPRTIYGTWYCGHKRGSTIFIFFQIKARDIFSLAKRCILLFKNSLINHFPFFSLIKIKKWRESNTAP